MNAAIAARAEITKAEREFPFTARDFNRVRTLIHRRAGIALADSKRDMVYSRLVRRLRSLDLSSFSEYLDQLETGDGNNEWQQFTNALTTNLTSFFRENHHFEILATLLRQQRQRPIRLWSSACSTGEEPYSMAMTACEALASNHPPVEILATDVDTQVLATATAGIYPVDRLGNVDAARQRRFFLKGSGPQSGRCKVRESLQRLIRFQPNNLLADQWEVDGRYTAIFCRNVMIYFDKPTQRAVLEKLVQHLEPEGLLFAGHSESFMHAADLVESCGRTVYRRARRTLA